MPLKYRDYQASKEPSTFDPEAGKASEDPFDNALDIVEEEIQPTHVDYASMSVKELKTILKTRGLSTSGKKADLVERLVTPEPEPVDDELTLSGEEQEVPEEEPSATFDEGVSELNAERTETNSLGQEDNDRTE